MNGPSHPVFQARAAGSSLAPLHLFEESAAPMAVADQAGTVIRVNPALCELLGQPRVAFHETAWADLHAADQRAAVVEDLMAVRAGHARTFRQAERRLRTGDGRELELLATLVPLADEHGEPRCVLAHLQRLGPATTSRRKRQLAVVDDQSVPPAAAGRQRVHATREATLAALGQRVLGGLGLDRLFGEVVAVVAWALGVEHAAVFEPRPGGRSMRLRAAVGWDDERVGLTLASSPPHPPGDGARAAVTLVDVLGEPRAADLAEQGVHAGAIALVDWAGDNGAGVLATYASSPHRFEPGDLDFLQATADLLGAGIAHHLRDDQRRRMLDVTAAASEHERAHITAALHEGPVQNLSVLSLRLEQARLALAQGRPETAERLLARLQESMAAEIAGIRQLMHQLRPPVLDELGLSEAVREQVHAFQRRYAVETSFESTLDGRLPADLEHLLYRVTQEALHSLTRHGQPDRVRVALHTEGDAVALRIAGERSGAGASAEVELSAGAEPALVGVRRQVEQAGGHWEVTTRPGGGSTLDVRFGQAIG
jgi:PAS domain S-box-containing protein